MKKQTGIEYIIKKFNLSKILIGYLIIIIVFGTSFFLLSLTENDGIYTEGQKVSNDVNGYLDSLYFSFVTSTSLGYGDIRPKGISRGLSIIEVCVSLVILGVLVSKLIYKEQDEILKELYDVSFQERYNRIIVGLYNFSAEIDRIITKIVILKESEKEEVLQSIESNLHLLSSYLADSEKILPEAQKNVRGVSDMKADIILDNLHSSIAKLEELASSLKKKGIEWKRKSTANSMSIILNSTEKICKDCIAPDYISLKEIIGELKKHSTSLRKFV